MSSWLSEVGQNIAAKANQIKDQTLQAIEERVSLENRSSIDGKPPYAQDSTDNELRNLKQWNQDLQTELERLHTEFTKEQTLRDQTIFSLQQQLHEAQKRARSTSPSSPTSQPDLIMLQEKLQKAGTMLKTMAKENADLQKRLEEAQGNGQEEFLKKHATELERQLEEAQEREEALILQIKEKSHKQESKHHMEKWEKEKQEMEKSYKEQIAKLQDSTEKNKIVEEMDASHQQELEQLATSLKQEWTKRLKEAQDSAKLELDKLKDEMSKMSVKDTSEDFQKDELLSLLTDYFENPDSAKLDKLPSSLQSHLMKLSQSKARESFDENSTENPLELVVKDLNAELEQLQQDRDRLASEHALLIEKMRQLKDTLQPKLQSDLGELATLREVVTKLQGDNELLVQQLTHLSQQNSHLAAELNNMVQENETLHAQASDGPRLQAQFKAAMDAQMAEQEKLQKEVVRLRAHLMEANDAQATEHLQLEDQVRELESQVAALHKEQEQWESLAAVQKEEVERMREKMSTVDEERSKMLEETEKWKSEWEKQSEALRNLQNVLEQFQASKEAEIAFATDSVKTQMSKMTEELEDYKKRALEAEGKISSSEHSGPALQQLQTELAEKNAVVGKLRHDVVQLQTHLVEALRRLKDTSENTVSNVDRRLLTNLFVQFLQLPRGDTKRYEILKIMSGILHFTEEEQVKVGLLRPRPDQLPLKRMSTTDHLRSPTTGEVKENFTDLWVTFLMKEAGTIPGEAGEKTPEQATTPRTSSFLGKLFGRRSEEMKEPSKEVEASKEATINH